MGYQCPICKKWFKNKRGMLIHQGHIEKKENRYNKLEDEIVKLQMELNSLKILFNTRQPNIIPNIVPSNFIVSNGNNWKELSEMERKPSIPIGYSKDYGAVVSELKLVLATRLVN